MKFEIVEDRLRERVLAPRRVRSEFTEALLAGKTLKLARKDRNKIGGNSSTLRKHGFQLRTGMINADEIVVWAEKIQEGKDDNGR